MGPLHLNEVLYIQWHFFFIFCLPPYSPAVPAYSAHSATASPPVTWKQRIYSSIVSLKGECHEIFDFWFFSWISFPQATEYTSTAFSIFFENSRRYLRLKVHHRCQRQRQMEKIFKQKNFNNLVWAPLGSRVTTYINFCLQVHFKVSAAWYCSHYLPPVSTTPAANLLLVSLIPVAICHRRRWHRQQICRRYRWHRWPIFHRCQ